jgi:hypothetical protein
MKSIKGKHKKGKRQNLSFSNETHARDDAQREKNINRKLNHLYALAEKFPEDAEIEREIEELETELSN